MNTEIVIVVCFGIYLLAASIKAILIGIGKVKDPIRQMTQKSVKMLIRGILAFVIFLVTCVYIVLSILR